MTATKTLTEEIAELNAKKEADRLAEEQERLNAAASYHAPTVEEGVDVFWYERADRGRQPIIAKVTRVRARMVDLQILGGMMLNAVRHLDDPTLESNPNHRENGAWDFTRAYKNEREERELIMTKLDDISKRLDEIEKRSAGPARNSKE